MSSYVDVEPLQPPFVGEITIFSFANNEKLLAVTSADADRLRELLGTDFMGRIVTVERSPDGHSIRVAVLPS